jgi:hypothetical protein
VAERGVFLHVRERVLLGDEDELLGQLHKDLMQQYLQIHGLRRVLVFQREQQLIHKGVGEILLLYID